MNQTERQRQERRQRMLAREQGREWIPGDTQPGTDTGAGVRVPKKVRRSDEKDSPEIPRPNQNVGNLKPLSPLLRRRRRRRQLIFLALVVAIIIFLLVVSGALSGLGSTLHDAADSAILFLSRGNADWPVSTGIVTPLHAEALGGGFLLMDTQDVAVFSDYGALIRRFQPGYGRPALAVGKNHFVLYNRAGEDLRMESRTETLYEKTFEGGILLCTVADNGRVAVVTQTERYPAVLQVLNTSADAEITYSLVQEDGVPVAADFAPDSTHLAVGALTAQGGQMQSLVYLLNTREETLGTCLQCDAASTVLRVEWLSSNRVLVVCDDYLMVVNADSGQETARYDLGGAVLCQIESVGNRLAILQSVRGNNTVVTLDENLHTLAEVPASRTVSLAVTKDALYLLDTDAVSCFDYTGERIWQQSYSARPQAVLDASLPLLVIGGTVQPLTAP